jgi:hypothetical protein
MIIWLKALSYVGSDSYKTYTEIFIKLYMYNSIYIKYGVGGGLGNVDKIYKLVIIKFRWWVQEVLFWTDWNFPQ